MPKIKKVQNNSAKLIVITILGLLAALIIGYLLGSRSGDPKKVTQEVVKEAPKIDTTGWETYTNETYGFSLQYPPSWTVSNLIVPKGEIKRRPNRYDVNAKERGAEVIEISQNDWSIELVVRKLENISDCGYFGTVQEDTRGNYTYLSVLNQDAARMSLEEGRYWTAPDGPEPHPQPIMFPVDSQLSDSVKASIGITGDAWNYNFCPTTSDNLGIEITYYSDEFTEDKIENKTLDYEVLRQMDEILQTVKINN